MTLNDFLREEFGKFVPKEVLEEALRQMDVHCPAVGEVTPEEIVRYKRAIELFRQIRQSPRGKEIMGQFRKQVHETIAQFNSKN